MSKISLPAITNGQDLATLNNNFAAVAAALNNNVLYRTNIIGEPNTLNQDLDFNGFKAYNLSDVLVNGVSISSEATIAQAAATQASASAVNAINAANASGASATAANTSAIQANASAAAAVATLSTSLLKANNLSDLASIATAKGNLSLGNVDNTSDVNKPVSTAQATALALKATIANTNSTGTLTAQAITLTNILTPSTTVGIKGTTLADNAQAGSIGEYITATGTAVPLTTAVAANVTSISLTAGDWDVWGNIVFNAAGTTVFVNGSSAVSTVSAATPSSPLFSIINGVTFAPGTAPSLIAPRQRLNLSATTMVYLIAGQTFNTSTLAATGYIAARRVR